MSEKAKTGLIVVAVAIVTILAIVLMVQVPRNHAISLEESVETTKSDISVIEKKRADLVYNLADCVKQYSDYEAGIVEKFADARVDNTSTQIKAIAENYPELKADKEYNTLMLELTTLENEVSQKRSAYNKSVTEYNRYTKSFLPRVSFGLNGYEVQDFKRIEYKGLEDAPQDLFKDRK